jgi:glycosyltransferase involved in cell wall biosynthesis
MIIMRYRERGSCIVQSAAIIGILLILFGLVILEALASGLPVAARGIPELREIFGDGVAFFDTPEEAQELVLSKEKLRLSGDRARQFTKRFDIRLIAEAHAKLYRRLAEP